MRYKTGRKTSKPRKTTFTVRFDLDDVGELRLAMGNRGTSSTKTKIYAAIRRLVKAGKINERVLRPEN